MHRILAGSDVVVVPSRLEPGGLVQMYAQRYGTLPVVRNTGGLRDTVVDLVAQPDGTGFVFHEPRADALVDTLARALRMRPSPAGKPRSVRAMGLDRSWARSAKRRRGPRRTPAPRPRFHVI
ncbi:MAG: glycosyltransferase [Polyangiaceae bacterium]